MTNKHSNLRVVACPIQSSIIWDWELKCNITCWVKMGNNLSLILVFHILWMTWGIIKIKTVWHFESRKVKCSATQCHLCTCYDDRFPPQKERCCPNTDLNGRGAVSGSVLRGLPQSTWPTWSNAAQQGTATFEQWTQSGRQVDVSRRPVLSTFVSLSSLGL